MDERYDEDDHLTGRTLLVAAAYVVLRRDGHILLERRAGTGYRDGHWALLAGHVDPGESVVDAAVREAHEESGVELDPADLVPLTAMHRFAPGAAAVEQRLDVFFEARSWRGEPTVREPDKADAMAWFDLTALPRPMVPHEAWVVTALAAGTALPAVCVWRTDHEDADPA